MKIYLTGALLLLSSSVFAKADNLCYHFGVQVLNKTNTSCTLTSYVTENGEFVSINPNSQEIAVNANHLFTLTQGMFSGPTLLTNYSCGGKNISLESHQNLCVLEAGSIRGNIINADPGINATLTSTEGSYFYSYPGQIYWNLTN